MRKTERERERHVGAELGERKEKKRKEKKRKETKRKGKETDDSV